MWINQETLTAVSFTKVRATRGSNAHHIAMEEERASHSTQVRNLLLGCVPGIRELGLMDEDGFPVAAVICRRAGTRRVAYTFSSFLHCADLTDHARRVVSPPPQIDAVFDGIDVDNSGCATTCLHQRSTPHTVAAYSLHNAASAQLDHH